MDNIVEKIRKLLALANNSGATEAEATRALEMASLLMLKHNIAQDTVDARENADTLIVKKTAFNEEWDDRWHGFVVSGVAQLNSCKGVEHGRGGFSFVGRESNVDACLIMLPFIVRQIEHLYKQALPPRMSKAMRANFRRSFKQACAARIYQRIGEILHNMRTNNEAAIAATGSRALVIVASIDQQLHDAEEWMMQNIPNLRKRKQAARMKFGYGTAAGHVAGDKVQLNRAVKGDAARRLLTGGK